MLDITGYNTGCPYTKHGQRIAWAELHKADIHDYDWVVDYLNLPARFPEGWAAIGFADFDRMISGVIFCPYDMEVDHDRVQRFYMDNTHTNQLTLKAKQQLERYAEINIPSAKLPWAEEVR